MPRKAHHKPASDDTPTHDPPACATYILTSRDGPEGREIIRLENPDPAYCVDERARASWESDLRCGEPFTRSYRNLETIWGSGPHGKEVRGTEDDKLDVFIKARPGQRSIREVLRILLRFLPAAPRLTARKVLLDHVAEVTGKPTGLAAEREQRLSLARLQQQFERRGALLAEQDEFMARLVEVLALILFDQYREALRRCTPRKPRVAVFGSARSVLTMARGSVTLGMGSQSLQIAESRGRTRSHWGEVGVRGTTHTGSGRVKNLGDVERIADAENALAGAGLDKIDRAALEALADGAKTFDVVERYRTSLPLGYEITDEAIKQRIKRARRAAETHLRKIPERALAIAMELGDPTLAQPWIPPGKERSQKPHVIRPARPAVEPIELALAGDAL